MFIDIDAEKRKFCKRVKINKETYSSELEIGKRTRAIFGSFTRVLHGRINLDEVKKETELNNLIRMVREDFLQALLRPYQLSFLSQTDFDSYHKYKVINLQMGCPISWQHSSQLTVGMCHKIINLHCKDLWALNLVPSQNSVFFHPIIDEITLRLLSIKIAWTKLDSYEEYMRLQK